MRPCYRMEDALRVVTQYAIRETRSKEITQKHLASDYPIKPKVHH